jgi:hypothetical protein
MNALILIEGFSTAPRVQQGHYGLGDLNLTKQKKTANYHA